MGVDYKYRTNRPLGNQPLIGSNVTLPSLPILAVLNLGALIVNGTEVFA